MTDRREYASPQYKRARKQWEPKVEAGQVQCRRAGYDCLMDDPIITPGTPWDLGHPDDTCPLPLAPEHRKCNRTIGGRNGRATQLGEIKPFTFDWLG